MGLFGARIFIKTGAEASIAGAITELGLGIAPECDDGAGRAAEIAMAELIARPPADEGGMEAAEIRRCARAC